MATVSETQKAFNDNLREGFIRIYVEDADGPLANRVCLEKPDLRERDDGLKLRYPNKTFRLNDNLDTFSPGDAATLRQLLLKVWNATDGDVP